METITSIKNPLIQEMRSLKDKKARDAHARMLVEGEKLLREALNARLHIAHALIRESDAERYRLLTDDLHRAGASVILVPDKVMEAVCDTRTPQGVCADVSLPEPFSMDAPPMYLVALDGVQDPGNVGTIWRTADAAGFGGMILGGACADPFSPKVQRAAMGSGFRLPVLCVPNLPETLKALGGRNYSVIATALNGQDFYRRPRMVGPRILIIGSEARGIGDDVMECASIRLKLPMRGGAESLNAAVAAGIMMYELMRDDG